ncbi:hypothetical protein AcW1_006310 [Taiwanofungus camphoratus]|nr:hypothetical protein AcW1_006310 [Antrodia cinnamomea]
MECLSATATRYTTLISSSLSTSFSNKVTSAEPTISTFITELCATTTPGLLQHGSLCLPKISVSTVGGGESTVQVPIILSLPFTQTMPIGTLYASICPSSNIGSQSGPAAPTSTSSLSATLHSSSPSTAFSPTLNTGSSAATTAASYIPTTIVYESTSTLSGGSVVTTELTSTYTIAAPVTNASASDGTGTVTSDSGSSNTGTIAGAIAGGVAALALLALLFSWCWHRKKHIENISKSEEVYTEIVRRRKRREGVEIDGEPRPFAHVNSPLIKGHYSTVPSFSPRSTSPSLPTITNAAPLPTALSRTSQSTLSRSYVSGPQFSGLPGTASSSRDVRDTRRPPLQVANRQSDLVQPVVALKDAPIYLHSGRSASFVAGPSNAQSPVPGPSIAAGPVQRVPFIHQHSEYSHISPSSAQLSKAEEAVSDDIHDAEPPPAYTE